MRYVGQFYRIKLHVMLIHLYLGFLGVFLLREMCHY